MADSFLPRANRLTRAGAFVTGLATMVGGLSIVAATPAEAAARPAASSKIWVSDNSYGKFELTWRAAKRATRYKVIVARDAAMKDVVFTKSTPKRHSWVLDPDVKEGARYYYRVRSYNGKKAGAATKPKAVRTRVQPVRRPENVIVKPAGTSSVTVSWEAAARATGYTVKLHTTPNGAPFWSKRTTATSMTVTGLTRSSFFVTVTSDRIQRTFNNSRTVYGATAMPVPGTGRAFTARVGSYNVMQYKNDMKVRTWASRRAKAAALIDDLDVVGVQESTWGSVEVSALSGLSSNWSRRPIAQLAKLAGLKLAWNDAADDPCGLHSIHVLYRESKFELTSCGEKALPYDNRYMTWTVLKERESQQSVLVVNTHLMNGATANAQREAEARVMVDKIEKINSANLPVIITGDLNSWHGRVSTTPLSLLVGAGFHPADLTSPTLVNGRYGTSHAFKPTLTNSIRIDHIFTSDKVLTTYFKVRLSNPSTAPSDHHPVAAAVSVYH